MHSMMNFFTSYQITLTCASVSMSAISTMFTRCLQVFLKTSQEFILFTLESRSSEKIYQWLWKIVYKLKFDMMR